MLWNEMFKEIILKVAVIFSLTIGMLFLLLDTSDVYAVSNPSILEIVSFETSKDTSTQQVLNLSSKVTQDLKNYEGFIKRTLTQNTKDPNQWVDIIEWKSMDDAHTAMNQALKNKDVEAFLKLMKNGSRIYQTNQNI
ncbi:EbhA protein [Francisella noatunensis subsp. orientalis]|uniref:EbhA protein n=1 Tax=Francisella orientalis TaxID=299583 RepID=A0AAW9YVQ9_9GAMM|nr:antibiotic biosynthesis monooxygenase [Francisella orientalis]MBK2006050.1 antibiotic biosynthesis monooxygenase [Francisella orientalis]MBK2008503.1 antibiotic biosynthesis monooxygenase [Francisella orientalis]MBK2009853.1 antibiotic biosynthesis monooxygenase [Francisella orientalis]MBK2010307.1 antibiotic biosynthesis monooxygenase [Francisella orientalis]